MPCGAGCRVYPWRDGRILYECARVLVKKGIFAHVSAIRDRHGRSYESEEFLVVGEDNEGDS